MRLPHSLLACLLLLGTAGSARAQATLSGQGFGYPPGQISSRALGTGGALGELDPVSALNPAALGLLGPSSLYFQYEPEFRRVRVGAAEDRTTAVRFPLIVAALPASKRMTVGVSASTLLDRTWSTSIDTMQVLGSDTLRYNEVFRSAGASSDIRLAGAWSFSQNLHVGLGAHVFTGGNRLLHGQAFTDTVPGRTGGVGETTNLNFSGVGLSGGFAWRPARAVSLAASARKGGAVRVRNQNDSLLAEGSIPDRVGASVGYSGISGVSIVGGLEWERWSKMRDLVATNSSVFDSWTAGLGAEAVGPRFGGETVLVRAGGRRRTLPFGVGGSRVRETVFSGGAGIPLGGNHALFDVTLQRAWRNAGGAARERAWVVSVGVTVRP